MRVLFLILLLANAALLLLGIFADSSPAPRQELNPEKIRILAPK
jgi:hypothetical protein